MTDFFLFRLVAAPLGWLLKLIYTLINSFGFSLILFTIIVRAIMLPLNIKQQKSSARQALLSPKIKQLQKKYANNREKLSEEQMRLYAEEGVNPMGSCWINLIPMLVLFSFIRLVYMPLTYVSNVDKDTLKNAESMVYNMYVASEEAQANQKTIQQLINELPSGQKLEEVFSDEKTYPKTSKIDSEKLAQMCNGFRICPDVDKFLTNENYISKNNIRTASYGQELVILTIIQHDDGKYRKLFEYLVGNEFTDKVYNFNYSIAGVSLGRIPTFKSWICVFPILSFVFQILVTVVSQHYTKKNNPEAADMMKSMNIMLYGMPLFSLWFTFKYPIGLGLYWVVSALFSLFQTIFLNKVYTPEKVQALIAKEDKTRKKSGKKNMFEKALELQEQQNGTTKKSSIPKEDYDDEKPKSRSKQKNQATARLNEARKREAAKYGEDYNED